MKPLFKYFFLKSLFAFVVTFFLFSVIRTWYVRKNRVKTSLKREILIRIFTSYLAVLSVLLFTSNAKISSMGINLTSANFDFVGNFKDRMSDGAWGVNFYPFRTMKSYIKYSGFSHTLVNILGNIVIFLPFGILVPEISKRFRKLSKLFLLALLTSFFIEFTQFFIGRSVDIDDVILNVTGGVIGFLIWRKFLSEDGKKKSKKRKVNRFKRH
ncbi:VanZ family protein [Peptoniphilus sp.]|jgi:glycopeptide antibiotics resistance protein|uniref:VanZ family protein n=1 Tax=Peptoniphilus sp. TaxID=1971214 RepID=UPI003D94A731